MSNVNYEQQLVDSYWENIKTNDLTLINKNCKAKKYADLEYLDNKTSIYWRIEAKSHMSKDAYNAVHKIFGELLKETGRDTSPNKITKYGLLIDGRYCPNKKVFGKDFFMKCFNCINYEKYKSFGTIIPIENIFVFNITNDSVENIHWNSFLEEKNDQCNHRS